MKLVIMVSQWRTKTWTECLEVDDESDFHEDNSIIDLAGEYVEQDNDRYM